MRASAASSEPDDARQAIAMGLQCTQTNQWEQAQEYFEMALTLPGTGVKRFRDKPRLLSNSETVACLYNIACCQSKLAEECDDDTQQQQERIHNGLVALAGCLENGYDDFEQLRNDPDLEMLRKNEKFEGLLKRFQRSGGFMNVFKQQ